MINKKNRSTTPIPKKNFLDLSPVKKRLVDSDETSRILKENKNGK